MDEVVRGNKLPYNPSDAIEYAVHGLWKRNPDDENGVHGCWYIGLKELMLTFKDFQEEDKYVDIRAQIELFEAELLNARTEAFERLAGELEAGDEDDD